MAPHAQSDTAGRKFAGFKMPATRAWLCGSFHRGLVRLGRFSGGLRFQPERQGMNVEAGKTGAATEGSHSDKAHEDIRLCGSPCAPDISG